MHCTMHITFIDCNWIVFHSGVIVDHEYLGDKYEPTLEKIKETIERVIREDLRGAGLNVKYYSWSRINFNKGEPLRVYLAFDGKQINPKFPFQISRQFSR